MSRSHRAKHDINRERTGQRKLLSILLCLSLLMGMFNVQMKTAFAASELESVTVTCQGVAADRLTLSQEEKITLRAECTPAGGALSYQWQVLDNRETGLWVDIYGAREPELSLSYVMLDSLLDESGDGYIRCEASGGGSSLISAPVCITVIYSSAEEAPAQDEDAVAQNEDAAQDEVAAAQSEDSPEQSAVMKSPAYAPGEAPEYVDIFVNYLDAVSGKPIYTGFTAQIQYGTSYSNTVISPTYLGYAPYYNAANPAVTIPEGGEVVAEEDGAIISLNLTETYTEAQYVVNVYYKAIDVPYGVRYYFQNINDDMYNEDVGLYRISAAKTGTIISNAELEVQDADRVRGFTKLYHYPEAVAADGSTVFQCYYDRNYYMLKFDMDGGYGTEPLYGRYGTPFAVNAPTRHGYIFAGWDDITSGAGDGTADVLPDTIPDRNLTYKALWDTVDTTYTTVYWLRNADNDSYGYIGSVAGNAESGSVISGSDSLTATTPVCGNAHTHTADCEPQDFEQYVYNSADENVIVKGDGSTVVNVYYERKEYKLRFFYAREKDGVFQLVGGTTYPFGNNSFTRPDDYTVENLLAAVYDWGNIKALPTVKAQYADKYRADTLSDSARGYTYHYLELTARFGAELSDSWPGEVFEPIEVDEIHTSNGASSNMGEGKWGNYAYLAGWNGEFKVKYTKDNSNSTIKGMYQKLGQSLLYDSSEGTSEVVNFLGYFNNGANIGWSVPRQWLYELYVPAVAGEEKDLTYDGVDYRLYKSIDTSDNNTTIAEQTQTSLYGFTAKGNRSISNGVLADGRESYTAQFFYARQSYNLTVYNYGQLLSQNRMDYQWSLETYGNSTPPYPDTLEEDAYVFGGWYYSPECYSGSEYKAGDRMPAKDIGLYAKWTPVNHTVRFFSTYEALLAYEATGDERGLLDTRQVVHGNILGTVENPADTSGFGYTFGGWFYMKAGKKTAYTPLDMPVTNDHNVFADWGSHSAQPYRVHYALHIPETDADIRALLDGEAGSAPKDNMTYTVTIDAEEKTYVYLDSDGGYHLLIAADSAGFAYQGNTRTFFPKAGEPLNQLYGAYNHGYFPTLASHSITVEYEENKETPIKNVFTFTYVYAADISYKVEYRELDTGELIASAAGGGTVVKTSSKAVVTERFEVIADYIPDAFYKRLILAVEKDEHGNYTGSKDNIVVFYYSKNTQNAFYAVHHMLQKLGAEGDSMATDSAGNYINYDESDARTEGIGQIGSTHRIVPQSFSGFSVKATGYVKGEGEISLLDAETVPHFDITIHRSGTELYVFYTRNTQNYKVYYLTYGTDVSDLSALSYTGELSKGVLLPIETGTGEFGSYVTASAKTAGGMSCVSNPLQRILLRANDEQNYMIFYYAPLQYTVEYKVWKQGGGTLSQTIEVKNGIDVFSGSEATPKSGYRFEGWYLDEDCTLPVGDKGTVTDGKLLPEILKLEAMPKTNVFFAKFTPVLGELTITRENAADEDFGNRVFAYRITSAEAPDFELFATVRGNGSIKIKNLICREYTIEQQNGWSWRYTDGAKTITLSETGGTVTFGGASAKHKWLSANSERIINRKS